MIVMMRDTSLGWRHLSLFYNCTNIKCRNSFLYLSYKSVKQPKTDILFTDALNAMVRGDKAKAIGILRQVVKQDSNHVRAYLQLETY